MVTKCALSSKSNPVGAYIQDDYEAQQLSVDGTSGIWDCLIALPSIPAKNIQFGTISIKRVPEGISDRREKASAARFDLLAQY